MGHGPDKNVSRSSENDDLVLTPGGWRPRSKAVKVEPGQHAEVQDGRLKVVDTETGEVVADLGEVRGEGDKPRRRGGPMKRAGRPDGHGGSEPPS